MESDHRFPNRSNTRWTIFHCRQHRLCWRTCVRLLAARRTCTQNQPWINHEILSEVLLAFGVDTLGSTGLLGIKCLLGVGLIGAIIATAARRGSSFLGVGVVALLVALNLMHFWMLRPQLLSYVFFATLLSIALIAFFVRDPKEAEV